MSSTVPPRRRGIFWHHSLRTSSEVATAGYVIDEIADDAIGILQFHSFDIAELVTNRIIHLPVAAVWLARCTALTFEVNNASCQIGLTLGITGSVLLIIFKSLISLCFITCLIRISLNLKNDQKNRPHDLSLF